MRSRGLAALAGLAFGLVTMFAMPAAPASAHAALAKSDPPAGTVVDAPPTELVLTFTEPVRAVADKIRVIGPDGKRADLGKPSARGEELRIPLRPDGPRGTYVVGYRIISADNHPVAGGLTFSVGAASENAAVPEAPEAAASRPLEIGMGAARYLGYAGLVLLAGPVMFLLLLWPRRLSTAGPARLAFLGAGALAVSTVAELVVQVPYSTGGGFSSDAVRQVLASPYGAAHLVRAAALAALLVVLRPVVSGKAGPADRALLGLLAVVGTATWPISGHPSASPAPSISVAADAVHLAAMAVWLGGLVMLVGFLLRQGSTRELGAILPVWSRWALLAISALAVTGSINALVEVGSVDALTGTGYGRLVLAKVLLLGVIVLAAAFARRWVRGAYPAESEQTTEPESEPGAGAPESADAAARRGIRRSVLLELGIAALVIGVASALVQTTPARTAQADAAPSGPFAVTLNSTIYQLQVTLDPAAAGLNTLHLYAYTPAGAPQKVVEWQATAGQPAQGIEPAQIPLVAITESHVTGQVALPTPGTWELRFTLRISELDRATVSQQVQVR